MHKVIFVLSCLSFVAHGRGVQTSVEQMLQFAKDNVALRTYRTSPDLRSKEFKHVRERPSASKRLVMLLAQQQAVAYHFATLGLRVDACYVVPRGQFFRSRFGRQLCLFGPQSVQRCARPVAMDSRSAATDCLLIFGRIADKMFVEKPEDIQGTAASGYEFGTLEAGRPKWICTYLQRSGQTQGGGSEVDHVPAWRGLFGDDESISKAQLAVALRDLKFTMPLGAPYGARPTTADKPSDAAIDAFWRLMGGSEDDAVLSAKTASMALSALTKGKDSFTFPSFSEAMEQA